jgi:acetolactate synthase I/II/III large subunit
VPERLRTTTADLLAILYDEGVGHLFVNPGMHTAPLREALAEAEAAGGPHLQPVLCVHEHVALCAAHGHHLAGGGPQAVMVHVESGTLNLGPAAGNAQRDRVPVTLFCGGGAECRQLLEALAAPGSGPEPALMNGASKWAVDLSRGGDLGALTRRAFQIARAEPMGLTHVALPMDLLGLPAGPTSRRLPPPRPPAPDLGALEEMAELLTTAESPVIVAGRVGRQTESVHHLARLAETLAAPVIDFRNHVNLPPKHPLNAALEGRDLLARADAVLLLDVDLPHLPGLGLLPPQAWLLQIDTDCLKADLPGWASPIEIAVTADTQLALPALLTMLADRLTARRRKVDDRRKRVERTVKGHRDTWRDRAASAHPGDRADAVVAELHRWLPEDTLILEEAAAGIGSTLRQLERPPGQYFRAIPRSPGWCLGAALGARLARPGQPVVAICDDAAFLSSLPSAAFWTAHRDAAPFLTVVLEQPGRRARPGDGQPDVVSVARAAGAEAVVADEAGEIAEALEQLLATTRDGVCAVLDVRLPAPEGEAVRQVTRRSTATSRSTQTKRQPA